MSGKTNVSVLHAWNHDSADEAAREIFESVGDISGIEIYGQQILVGVYVRPTKTRGGVITVESAQKEDFYQGKVGLILKMGAEALDDPDGAKLKMFGGRMPKVGDWVFMSVQQVWQLSIQGEGAKRTRDWNGWPCRLLYPADIYGRIASPKLIGGVV